MNKAQVVKVSDMLPKREINQNAETIQEIQKECGLSGSQTAKLVKALLEEGRVRKVFKKVGESVRDAYLPVKK